MNIDDVGNLIQQASKVTLRGGVVGKVCTVVLVTSVCTAVLGVASQNPWIIGGGILGILMLTFTMLSRVLSFADRNPQAALLEGAEFLVHQQMILGTKAEPVLITDAQAYTEENPQGQLPSAVLPSESLDDDAEETAEQAFPKDVGGKDA